MGCIYRRGKRFWIKYYRNGKPYTESTHSDKREVAKALLSDYLPKYSFNKLFY